ncbi:MAG: zinc-ribbon domain-containing protein, partial [Clostridia bacterium]|nr:zinc-ribbon domain-containing protein [Clostridia bacterium]
MRKSNLAADFPSIAKEWDYEKNYPLLPENVGKGYDHAVWWICPKGHSYSARVDHRTYMKSGCSYCSGKKVLAGFNDLKTRYPDIAAEWNYEKNSGRPEDYMPGSHESVWWTCPLCQQPYQRRIDERIHKHFGCKNCSKERGT